MKSYEVSMSGGSPWGFRIAKASLTCDEVVISRVTPGSKACQANVIRGDVLKAVNTNDVTGVDLPTIMAIIKNTGWNLNLTMISSGNDLADLSVGDLGFCTEMIARQKNTRNSENREGRRRRRRTQSSEHESQEVNESKEDQSRIDNDDNKCDQSKEEVTKSTPHHRSNEEPLEQQNATEEVTERERSATPPMKVPDYIKQAMKPARQLPSFKPQVHWLHGKLRLNMEKGTGLDDAGTTLKQAALLHPRQPIAIEGPISGTILHSQYNTPVQMYSSGQIINTMVSSAGVRGNDVSGSLNCFGLQDMTIDTNTSVYKRVHHGEGKRRAPAQSRSIYMLNALLGQSE